MVSIIIATYRRFDFIESALDSVFCQNYPQIELILADDGSAEFPQEEINSYISRNARGNIKKTIVYSNEQNLGTVRNLNTAHKISSGTIAIELAGDDEFTDETVVSQVVRRMQETECGVLAMTRLVVDDQGEEQYYLPHLLHKKKVLHCPRKKQYEMMVSGQFYAMFSGSALAIRKDIFDAMGGYDEKYILWEDGPFCERYLRENRIEPAYDIVGIRYRLGGVSTGEGHPQLKKEMEIYNSTDRLSRLEQLSPFYQALTRYNVLNEKKPLSIMPVLLYKLYYRLSFKTAEAYDRNCIRNKQKA